jgi:hypothetical protein
MLLREIAVPQCLDLGRNTLVAESNNSPGKDVPMCIKLSTTGLIVGDRIRKLSGPQNRSGQRGEEKILSLPGLEQKPLRRPALTHSAIRLLGEVLS